MRRFAFLLLLCATSSAQELRLASLGDFKLDNGDVIRDCRIGYRTYGQPGTKTVIVTTWLGGTTAGLASSIGPGKLFDSSKYYVISIDALSDGVSSYAPNMTIRDMVRSQHDLLTREMHIDHVYAVSGLSMGGMQTFQWLATYPDFMDKAIAITGTTKQTSYDLLLWKTELQILESGLTNAMDIIANMNTMHLNTPAYVVEHVKAEDTDHPRKLNIDPKNYASQLRAVIAHDVSDISPTKAKVLVIVSLQDQMVNPTPAREFARTHGAELVTLSGDCGHTAAACEEPIVRREVWRFLDR